MPKSLRILSSQQDRPLGDQTTALHFQLMMWGLDNQLSLMERVLGREDQEGTRRISGDLQGVDVLA